MILGIDAHNLRAGGGITHLINLLIQKDFYGGFDKIHFFGGRHILGELEKIQPPAMKNVEIMHEPILDKGLVHRIFWQQHMLPKRLEKMDIDILFSPGGILPYHIAPNITRVTMCHNMLPIQLKETLHLGMDLRFLRFLILRILQVSSFRTADGVIFISRCAQTLVKKLSKGLSNQNAVIYHGINPIFFRENRPVFDNKKRIDILYVSTVDVYKHQWVVVKALALLRERGYDNLYLRIIGSDYRPAARKLERTIRECRMEDRVERAGAVSYSRLPREYYNASIFVFASSCENCPNILLEAMASGLPIACSQTPPMNEFTTTDSVNYFDPVRPESIAEAIRDLVDHPQKAARLGKKAFELSRSYDWEHCARKSYELIRNAYRGHRSLFLKRPAWMIGPLPPPLIGQSLAFKMICDEMKRLGLPHRVLNIGGRQLERRDGSFSFSRSTNLIHPFLLASTLPFRKPKIVYLTIAQSWFGFLRDMLFIFFSSFGNHRIILHLHGGNYERFYSCQPVFRKALIRWSLSKAEKIVVLSESLKSMFDFLPDSRTRIAVVHNGLPSRSPGESLEPKSLPENGKSPVRILYLSNLIESKGYLDVLEAVHLLDSGHGISLEVHFCGKFLLGSDIHNYPSPRKAREDFEGRVREYGLSNRVVWKESVEGREKQEELGKAHFFILPTYYNNEGQPLSVIEAIASGCCVITTRYRAIPELVDHGNAGLFVEAKNPTAIAESVLSMIRDPKRYREVSRRAVRHYREHFTREAHLESLKREIFNIDPESMKGP